VVLQGPQSHAVEELFAFCHMTANNCIVLARNKEKLGWLWLGCHVKLLRREFLDSSACTEEAAEIVTW